jgi:hypothetical protein
VVASQKEEVLRIFDLVAHEEEDCFQRMLASVNVISKEKKVRSRREAAHLEHSDQIGVLTVNIAHNLDRRIQLEEGRLIKEQFSDTRADRIDFCVT